MQRVQPPRRQVKTLMKCAKANGNDAALASEAAFTSLVQHVFSLDSRIRWLAMEEAARRPRWAWRNPQNGGICGGMSSEPPELVDPLLFMIADGGCSGTIQGSGQEQQLLFAVLAYRNLVQVVARYGHGAHLTVAADPQVDAYHLGAQLTGFLTSWAHGRAEG